MTEAILGLFGGGLSAAIILIILLYRRIRALERDRIHSEREKLQYLLNTSHSSNEPPPHGRHRLPPPAREKGHLRLYIGGMACALLAGFAAIRHLRQARTQAALLALAAITGATSTYIAPTHPDQADESPDGDPGIRAPDSSPTGRDDAVNTPDIGPSALPSTRRPVRPSASAAPGETPVVTPSPAAPRTRPTAGPTPPRAGRRPAKIIPRPSRRLACTGSACDAKEREGRGRWRGERESRWAPWREAYRDYRSWR